MIVVISDLHFEEEQSDFIENPSDPNKCVGFTRNVNARAFENLVRDVVGHAEENKAQCIDLVFAGDIFDINRTSLWFKEEKDKQKVRPYVSCADVRPDSALEVLVLDILKRIENEKHVKDALAIFQNFADRRYRVGGEEHELSKDVGEVKLHYIPGNHDRLANSTPKIRRKVRQMLGMEASDDLFPHVIKRDDPRILIRHGHEYDRFNFSVDYTRKRTFKTPPDSEYDDPPIGDYVTVDFASRLPTLFRELFQDDDILDSNKPYQSIYLRLLGFDDVRPVQAVIMYLLSMKKTTNPKDLWGVLLKLIQKLLDDISKDPNLHVMLEKANKSGPDLIDAVRPLLYTNFWHAPFLRQKDVERFLATLAGGKSEGAEVKAKRELADDYGSPRLIVAGHTHKPQVALIEESDSHGERYYIDTGTWRNVVFSTRSKRTFRFGRVKALTYLIVYGSDEDPDKYANNNSAKKSKRESFDFLSGYTQRYFAKEF
jgi:UDP-2,3-diacylglucosamine pyrophosphatase LpxH